MDGPIEAGAIIGRETGNEDTDPGWKLASVPGWMDVRVPAGIVRVTEEG